MTALALSFLIFTVLLFLWILLFLFDRQKKVDKRLVSYLGEEAAGQEKQVVKENRQRSGVLKHLNLVLKKKLTTRRSNAKVESFLQGAGVSWSSGEYIAYRWITALIGAGLFFLLTRNVFLLALGLVIGYFVPRLWVNSQRKKRMKKFNDGLADMITSIINSLRAGFGFVQALQAVEEEVDAPIKEEIALVLKEMQYGSSLEAAFTHLYERMPSQDLDIMIQAILIQRQVGGNLATVLANIVDTIRERNKIHRQVKTLTAQGKMSGMVIGLMPFALGGIIFMISPTYVSVMFHNIFGIIMLVFGLVSGVIGFLLIRKLTQIEV